MWTVGIDFGGTNIKLGLVSDRGVVSAQDTLSTAEHATPGAFIRGVASAVERLARQRRVTRGTLRGIGVGAPGLIDGRRGVIHQMINVPGGWAGVPLARLLRGRLGCRSVIDNDANVAALGEWRFGAGRGTRHGVYITWGTGVGGGLILNGALVRGATGSAGEIGHVTLEPRGPRCACGNRGCLEAFVGTAALVREARAALRRGDRILARTVEQADGALTPEVISRAAAAGDPVAAAIWQRAGERMGIVVAGVVNLVNPECVVIGGGLANAWRWFSPSVLRALRPRAFRVPAAACRLARAERGNSAGILGAAMLVWSA